MSSRSRRGPRDRGIFEAGSWPRSHRDPRQHQPPPARAHRAGAPGPAGRAVRAGRRAGDPAEPTPRPRRRGPGHLRALGLGCSFHRTRLSWTPDWEESRMTPGRVPVADESPRPIREVRWSARRKVEAVLARATIEQDFQLAMSDKDGATAPASCAMPVQSLVSRPSHQPQEPAACRSQSSGSATTASPTACAT